MHKLVDGVQVPLTQAEIEEFNQREQDHLAKLQEDAKTQYQRDRQQAYPTIEALVVALVEKEEGRPEALNTLMAQRAAVKLQFPKP